MLETAETRPESDHVERILENAIALVDERLADGDRIEPESLHVLATAAVRFAIVASEPTFGLWVLRTYRNVGCRPPEEFIELFAGLARPFSFERAPRFHRS